MAFYENPMLGMGLRIAQVLFAIIVLGLTGHIISLFDNFDSYYGGYFRIATPSQLDFLLFCAIWTLLVVIVLTVVRMRFSDTSAAHPYVTLGLDAITMIFWFAGFIAVAALFGALTCEGNGPCSEVEAATAFGAFAWLAFAISTAIDVLGVVRSQGSSSGRVKAGSAPEISMERAGAA